LFGVAPALLMYHLEFQEAGKFAWVLCYIFIVRWRSGWPGST